MEAYVNQIIMKLYLQINMAKLIIYQKKKKVLKKHFIFINLLQQEKLK